MTEPIQNYTFSSKMTRENSPESWSIADSVAKHPISSVAKASYYPILCSSVSTEVEDTQICAKKAV